MRRISFAVFSFALVTLAATAASTRSGLVTWDPASAGLRAQSTQREGGQLLPVPAPKVPDKIAAQAEPFDLADVRLLDGPFRDAMLRDQKYLLALDIDRLLHNFRVNAGLPSSAKPLGGWEAPDVELRGHSLGHYLSALALMSRSTGDPRFKLRADAIVSELGKIQQALSPRFHPGPPSLADAPGGLRRGLAVAAQSTARAAEAGYLSAFPESLIDRVETRQQVWAPYYTLHKIMAGLLDVHLLCGNAQALDILVKMADWVKFRQDRLTVEQQQRMLQTEFGGMADVLANLYAVTGNPDHLRLARTFDHAVLFDPLARGEDPLNGLHGNTQFPKMIGAVREYELTGEKRYLDIATFFWQRVVRYRSYVIGGNTDNESFFPVDQFSRHLGASSTETCNTYNMLKLTRALFALSPSAEAMDFYERGLFNHILASQDPDSGMMCYYVPLKPGAFRTYSTEDDSFWCCVGTGMENHAKYGDSIYFHDQGSLYVNLFIASEVTWHGKGLVVRQETRFPDEDTTRLTMKAARPVRAALKIRYPSWAQAGITVSVNGRPQAVQATPGSYVTVDREWKGGDVVQVRLPMTVHTEAMPDDPKTIALLYGPIVLAGDLGRDGLQQVKRYGPSAPEVDRIRTPEIPVFVGDVRAVPAAVKAAGRPLTFTTAGLGRPREVALLPFYKAADLRYTVYWKVMTPAEWETRKSETAAAESHRQTIERRTVDAVVVNDADSERDHLFKGEGTTEGFVEGRKWRLARNGWFSYEIKASDKPLKLVCTYRGAGGRRPAFDILVDGRKIASESIAYHPTETFDVEYPLPEDLTRGKDRLTVRFQAQPNSSTGAVLDVRIVWADLQE